MILLALDQADHLGWAIWVDGAYYSGFWKMSAHKSEGERLLGTMRELVGLYDQFDGIDQVAYEAVQYRGRSERPKVLRRLHHVEAVVHLFCANKRIPEPMAIPPNDWRRSVLGGNSVKAPASLKSAADRKAWHETNARWYCRTVIGHEVEDGNEAEALCILEAFRVRVQGGYRGRAA